MKNIVKRAKSIVKLKQLLRKRLRKYCGLQAKKANSLSYK